MPSPVSKSTTFEGLVNVVNNNRTRSMGNETDLDNHVSDTNIHFAKTDVTKSDVGLGNVTNDAQIPTTQKGQANGVASLDGTGNVPEAQLQNVKGTAEASTTAPTDPVHGQLWLDLSES